MRSIALLLIAMSLFHSLLNQAQTHTAESSGLRPVQIAMRNVMYHYTGPVAVHIVNLQGELLPTRAGTIVVFDDKNSFTMTLKSAEIAIDCSVLAEVLNEDVFSSPKAPLKSLNIESKNNRLVIKGKLHQKGDVAFETTGTLSANGDGRIRLHSEHFKAGHLPVKGILDLLGIDLARLVNTNKVQGVSVDKDDILIDPQQILPPPHIHGTVTAVRMQGNYIVQVFGSPQAANVASRQAGNFIAFRGGDMRFGKLAMHDSDLILIDMNPRDPFDFFLDHYREQLVAGYTKITPEFGLRTYARDYDKLHFRPAGR
jgi:hypothetical protein